MGVTWTVIGKEGVYCEYVSVRISNIGLFMSVNVSLICRAFFGEVINMRPPQCVELVPFSRNIQHFHGFVDRIFTCDENNGF
jgi:hypothetical protein